MIKELSNVNGLQNVFNQYSVDYTHNSIRRKNLFIYLRQMSQIKPEVMLVGEAPGYHGCRFTGVPFTSEYILINGIGKDSIFGKDKGYMKTRESAITKREQTATIVWETMINHDFLPLMWNAFPFHPYKQGNPM